MTIHSQVIHQLSGIRRFWFRVSLLSPLRPILRSGNPLLKFLGNALTGERILQRPTPRHLWAIIHIHKHRATRIKRGGGGGICTLQGQGRSGVQSVECRIDSFSSKWNFVLNYRRNNVKECLPMFIYLRFIVVIALSLSLVVPRHKRLPLNHWNSVIIAIIRIKRQKNALSFVFFMRYTSHLISLKSSPLRDWLPLETQFVCWTPACTFFCASVTTVCLIFFVIGRVLTRLD